MLIRIFRNSTPSFLFLNVTLLFLFFPLLLLLFSSSSPHHFCLELAFSIHTASLLLLFVLLLLLLLFPSSQSLLTSFSGPSTSFFTLYAPLSLRPPPPSFCERVYPSSCFFALSYLSHSPSHSNFISFLLLFPLLPCL